MTETQAFSTTAGAEYDIEINGSALSLTVDCDGERIVDWTAGDPLPVWTAATDATCTATMEACDPPAVDPTGWQCGIGPSY
jgi:hypothetical protein